MIDLGQRVRAAWNDFRRENRAQATASNAAGTIVGIMVAALTAAFLLPIAIDEIVGIDTSSWSSGAGSLWGVLDVMIVLAVFLVMVHMAVSEV